MTARVCVIPGDDAAPEAVASALRLLKSMELDVDYLELPDGAEGRARYGDDFEQVCREAIDGSDTTLFGSSSGQTPALNHLRWGKGAYANVRPVRYIPGARSPLRDPTGIDFVIVRENIEDLYSGVEGELSALAPLGFRSRFTGEPLTGQQGRFAIKVITEYHTRRIVDFAFRLARRRRDDGHPGKVTLSCKHNMLPGSDGYFREVARDVAAGYPDIVYEDFIVDDFARRIIATPQDLDVVVLPNLYGDILSDEAAALVGGLGMAPSACYADDWAYFEPVHGTAPDIAGRHVINPTATLLSAAMMLEYLEVPDEALRLRRAVEAAYADGTMLTPDQGGDATTDEFCEAVARRL